MQRRRIGLALLMAGVTGAVAVVAPGASGSAPRGLSADPLLRPLAGPDSGTFPGAEVSLPEIDNRGPRLTSTPGIAAAYRALGAHATTSWTQYGTPRTLVRDNGTYLAEGLTGTPEVAARGWLVAHAALFGLTDTSTTALQTWYAAPLAGSTARVVYFRQTAGGRPLTEDGLIAIGIVDGKIASVTSSAVPTALLGSPASTPSITAAQAVLAAAHNAGITALSLPDLTVKTVTDSAGFTEVTAPTLPQVQRTRLEVLPTTDRGAKLVWTTDVEDVAGAHALATESFVDATDSSILLRHDAVKTATDASAATASMRTVSTDPALASAARTAAGPSATGPANTFSGTYTPTTCSTPDVLAVPVGTATVVVSAGATSAPTDDIKLELHFSRTGSADMEVDTATSPEVGTYPFSPPVAAGETFSVSVCALDATQTGGTYSGTFVTSTQAVSTSVPSLPAFPNAPVAEGVNAPAKFSFFQANPVLGYTSVGLPAADNRSIACGPQPAVLPATKTVTDCQVPLQTALLPDAFDTLKGVPTNSTTGNNAVTTNAQASTSLTPGPPGNPYLSATRDYNPAYQDIWKSSGCDPTTLVGTDGADVNTAMVNLFTGHNRIHDFAYRLGLNDITGSLQSTNATTAGASGDPELGATQNAAATDLALRMGGPVYSEAGLGLTGRNNANQITMQDGVPGITNQYLFEPVLGFYGPCSDGDLDSSVFLHEYTHAISNRLIAGPDVSLSGQEGGSMGESWSDLDALEFLNAFGVAGKDGSSPDAEGAFVTGNNNRGIRDYNLLSDPLTYGEFGFDTTGPEVHADGEVWNGIQWAGVRQAMIASYDAKGLSHTDAVLEKACAFGEDTSGKAAPSFDGCPGDRRWIQYVYDSLILQGNGAPTFVDMKNTQLAGALMRGSMDDYNTMATAFAKRGIGTNATAVDGTDTDPVPGFASPVTTGNAHVTFSVVDADTKAAVPASVFVGTYTARATPLASTIAGKQPATAEMTAGAYNFVVQAPGYGINRLTATFTPGQTTTQVFSISKNFASKTSGATVVADQAGAVRAGDLIDDSEATDTGYSAAPVAGKSWTVALGGGSHVIQRVNVSAMHHPVDTTDATDFQSRITDLRAFDLQTSNDGGKTFQTVYSSPGDFFPGSAPRTVAPDVALRSLTLPAPVTADHVRLVVRSTQCTGGPAFAKDLDNDPLNDATCPTSASAPNVTVADLEVFAPAAVGTAGNAAPVTTTTTSTTKTNPTTKTSTAKKAAPSTKTTRKAAKKVAQPTRTLAFTGAPEGVLGLGLALLLLAFGLMRVRRRNRLG